jgi:hypothetical protein
MKPLLSILTSTISGRETQLQALKDNISKQIGELPVEHLVFWDNRRRLNGAKRQSLMDIARGEYFAYVDDDDDVADNYVASILEGIKSGADIVTFKQRAIYNGLESEVHFGVNNQDGPFNPGGITLRAPWHICAWRKDKVMGCVFGNMAYNEDTVWCLQARKRIKTAHHIDKVLHTYRHDAATTAAPENTD